MAELQKCSAFQKGDSVVYTSNSGAANIAVILKVHYEDDPPFYTIHIAETDIEKQTDEKNLTYLPIYEDDEDEEDDLSPPPAPRSVGGGKKGTVTKSQQFFGIGLLSLGVVGVAAMGLLMMTYSKNLFKRRL
jgi:hypothetical protein